MSSQRRYESEEDESMEYISNSQRDLDYDHDKGSSGGSNTRETRPLRSSRNTRKSQEPSFIMPAANGVPGFYQESFPDSTHAPQPYRSVRRRAPRASTRRSSTIHHALRDSDSDEIQNNRRPRRSETRRYSNRISSYDDILVPFLQYLLGILRYVGSILQPLLGVIMSVVVVFGLVYFTSSFLGATVSSALAPLCSIPGSSYLLERCSGPSYVPINVDELPPNALEYEGVMKTESIIADMVAPANNQFDLPYTLRSTHESLRNLRRIVRYSNLRAKASFIQELSDLILTGEEIPDLLIKFNQKGPGAVRRLVYANEKTLEVLSDAARLIDQEEAKNPFVKWVQRTLFGQDDTVHIYSSHIYDDYVSHIAKTEAVISSMVTDAEELVTRFNHMDDILDKLGDLAFSEKMDIGTKRNALLSRFFTKIGGNREELLHYNSNLRTLSTIYNQQQFAVKQVGTWLVILKQAAENLKDVRESLSEPALIDWEHKFPINRHIRRIQSQMQDLNRVSYATSDALRNRKHSERPVWSPLEIDSSPPPRSKQPLAS